MPLHNRQNRNGLRKRLREVGEVVRGMERRAADEGKVAEEEKARAEEESARAEEEKGRKENVFRHYIAAMKRVEELEGRCDELEGRMAGWAEYERRFKRFEGRPSFTSVAKIHYANLKIGPLRAFEAKTKEFEIRPLEKVGGERGWLRRLGQTGRFATYGGEKIMDFVHPSESSRGTDWEIFPNLKALMEAGEWFEKAYGPPGFTREECVQFLSRYEGQLVAFRPFFAPREVGEVRRRPGRRLPEAAEKLRMRVPKRRGIQCGSVVVWWEGAMVAYYGEAWVWESVGWEGV